MRAAYRFANDSRPSNTVEGRKSTYRSSDSSAASGSRPSWYSENVSNRLKAWRSPSFKAEDSSTSKARRPTPLRCDRNPATRLRFVAGSYTAAFQVAAVPGPKKIEVPPAAGCTRAS
jgi:hypothetical protein